MLVRNFRYVCGECGRRTPWLPQSHAYANNEAHYAADHPGVSAWHRGMYEYRSGGPAYFGGSCLLVLASFWASALVGWFLL